MGYPASIHSEHLGVTGWYPYDVSNNLNEAWDHTRIHPDCFQRDEYTFLLYLNPELNPGELGRLSSLYSS